MLEAPRFSTEEVIDFLLEEADPKKRQVYYEKAALSLEQLEALKAEVDKSKDKNEARAYLAGQRAFELSQLLQNKEASAIGHWALAIGLSVQNEFLEAIRHFQTARNIYASMPNKLKAARVGLRQVQAYAMLGEVKEALTLALNVRKVFLAHNAQEELAMTDNNLGILYIGQADFAKAKLSLENALSIYKELANHEGMALSYINLADSYQEQDKFKEAESHLDMAIAIAKVAGQHKTEAGARVNLALLYRKEGHYSKALASLTRARDLYEQLGSPDKALAQLEEARILLDLNLVQEAERLAKNLKLYFEQQLMAFEQLEVLTLLAEIKAHTERTEEALSLLEEVKKGWLVLNNPIQAAQTMLSIISIKLKQGHDLVILLTQLQEAKSQLTARSLALTLALILEAQIYLLLGQFEKAQVYLNQAKSNALHLGSPHMVMRVLQLFGDLAQKNNCLEDAESYYKEAICYADSIRSSFAIDEIKLAFSNDHFDLYGDLIALLLAQKRSEEAFEYLVKAKSHIFLHVLAEDTSLNHFEDDEVKLRLQEAIQKERKCLDAYLTQAESQAPSESLRRAILMAEQNLNELIRDLKNLSQNPNLLIPKMPSLAEIRAELDEDTMLIEFYSSEQGLAAFVLTKQAIKHFDTLADLSSIETDLGWLKFYFDRLALGGVFTQIHGQDKLNKSINQHLYKLYLHCFFPITQALKMPKKLIIVPHAHLNEIPFNALFDGQGYLVERYQIALYPSSSILALRHQAKTSHKSVMAFALAHKDIPKAQEEVKSLAQSFKETQLFLEDEASLKNWAEHAQQANILHLATHGLFRPDNPMFSRLSFADGWLTARDLYTMRLKDSLVVLSACESGLTGTQRKNEHLGLVRAFFHAGANSLITTLWPVKDASTAELIELFYEHLRAGASVAEALQKAQLSLRKTYPNPYYWAAFQVNGNPNWSWL